MEAAHNRYKITANTLRNVAHQAECQSQELQNKVQALAVQQAELCDQLASTDAQLQYLLSPPSANEPATAMEEQALCTIVRHKLSQSTDGLLHVRGKRGRNKTLLPLTVAEVGSSTASTRSLSQCSVSVEKALQLTSTRAPDGTNNIIAQQASCIRRNQNQFVQAANQAGLNVFGKVQLTENALAALKSEMPTTMIHAEKVIPEGA